VAVSEDEKLEVGDRLTLKITKEATKKSGEIMHFEGIPVPITFPKKHDNVYWGYKVRVASSISNVWRECGFRKGYDKNILISKTGVEPRDVYENKTFTPFKIPNYSNLILFFESNDGISVAIKNDKELKEKEITKLFDFNIKTQVDETDTGFNFVIDIDVIIYF
jgi:methyltransferase